MKKEEEKNRDGEKEIGEIQKDIRHSHRNTWLYILIIVLVLVGILAGSYWNWW